MSSTTTTTKSTPKGSKKSKVVILRLPTDLLKRFAPDVSSSPPSAIKTEPSLSNQALDSADKSSESNSTPLPSNSNDDPDASSLAPPNNESKKKKSGGTASGRKRAPPSIDPDAIPRERARPGPKKKPRLADGTIDRSHDGAKKTPVPGANPISAHKLGPKANTGAINAGLRALDRSGKPCRRWGHKPLVIKSFTGAQWAMSTWDAPKRDSFSGDVKSDTTGSSDTKPNGSSALPSERTSNVDVEMTNGIESSPAPLVTA